MDLRVLRKFTNLQTKFMYVCKIKDIQLSSGTSLFGQDAIILLRETSIPEVSRDKVEYRFLNRPISLPVGYKFDGSWEATFVIDESLELYKAFSEWFYDVEKVGHEYTLSTKGTVGNYMTDVLVQLMTLDGKKINSVFGVINVFPINLPPIDGLTYDDTSGHLTMKVTFGCDAVIHGKVGDDLKIEWFEKDVYNFPYSTAISSADFVSGVNNYLT